MVIPKVTLNIIRVEAGQVVDLLAVLLEMRVTILKNQGVG